MSPFTNPVLPGCYPDPSVCRVGNEYFLVTSSFEYFPGLPIFRSPDLVNWEQIGHAIDRESQLDLSSVPSSGGLFAPTIRHHDGIFYIVNTLVHGDGRQGNFMITARDPAGPWSDPVWLDDAPGIDPSLLFDEGRAWYCGTRLAEPGLWDGQTDVYLRELDLDALRLGIGRFLREEQLIWRGALAGAVWAEGPHLYRIDGRYYLLAAEGGTEHNHAISVAASDDITGPYLGNPANPVLTHRNLGRGASIVGVGHADLVETPGGDWWAVLLATRTVDGAGSVLGRETNLVPVSWEKGWPVFAPGVGRVESVSVRRGTRLVEPVETPPIRDDFTSPELGMPWTLLRTAAAPRYSLATRPGWLRLPLLPAELDEVGAAAFVGRRLQHLSASIGALLDFWPESPTERAGLVLRQSEDANIVISVSGSGRGGRIVSAIRRIAGESELLARAPLAAGATRLGIRLSGSHCALEYSTDDRWHALASTSCAELASESAGGFLGVWVGMFATSSGLPSDAAADFDWFDYEPEGSA
jgi:alpha-N-arabinofuranosidase